MNSDVYDFVYCRLGNNLFQIAAGLTYAKQFNKKLHLVIKESCYNPVVQYPDFFDRFDFERIDSRMIGDSVIVEETYTQDPIFFEKTDKNVILDGFFQSERYIDSEYVRNAFKIKSDTKEYLLNKYDGILDGVGISVRRGDYLGIRGIFNVLSAAYYNDMYSMYFSGVKCFISSDDISWCRQNLKIKNCVFLDERDDIVMRALSLCKHHILSCSTFSWWSAWLEEMVDSVNVVPNKWFADGCGIREDEKIPSRWKRIDLTKEYLY